MKTPITFILLGFMVGVFSHAVLLFGVGIVGFDEYPKIPLIGGVVIGAIVFLITWVDRDKPLDNNTDLSYSYNSYTFALEKG